jgi:DNA-binding MarR family transcriptional regulator
MARFSVLSTAARGAASVRCASASAVPKGSLFPAGGVTGLTPAHANVIPFVPAAGIQIGELARLAKVRKQTMAQSVELLATSGYVTRRPDPNDRRASLIFLTAKGRALWPASRSAGQQVEQDWAAIVGRDNIDHLRRTLIILLRSDRPTV